MEENENYTNTYENETGDQKSGGKLKLVFAAIIVIFAVIAIILGIFFGVQSADNNETTTLPPETEATSSETTTVAPENNALYKVGKYSINTGGRALLFRKDHSKDSETIFEIADLTVLEITEIFHDENAESDDYEYWGKAEHLGHTGWLAMKYMKKEYSDNIITPDDITTTTQTADESTTAEATTDKPETTTNLILPPPESTPAEEVTTAAESVTKTPTTGKYSIGDYKVSTGGSTLTFRKNAGTSGAVILDIPDGEKVSVVEIVDTASSDENVRYWGRISYKGYSGYVCMTYLSRVN